ncbi:MAG: type II secretion system protein GspN [Desulfobacteraceae bacterium]|nr:type II secretion system protein GspN [Desulfobacteraceae bacterium]
MKNIKKWIAYILYILGLALVFLYLCFPADSFKRYAEHLAARAAPGVEASVEGLGPGFPPSMSAKKIEITYRGSDPVLFEHLEISPGYINFFIGKPFFNIRTEAAKGLIKGRIGIKGASEDGGRQISLQMDINGLHMEALNPVFEKISGYTAQGGLEGKLEYSGSLDMRGTGSAIFGVGEGTLNLNPPFYGIGKLEFSQGRAEMELKNRNLNISSFSINGRQFSLKGNGRVILSFPVEESRVNISSRITPHPALLKSIGNMIPEKYKRQGGIPMRITGTLRQSNYSFR